MTSLSILDLSLTTTAAPGAAALRQTIELARRAEQLGYRRFWVAEHHNLPSVASGAPEIMIGAIAAATSRIRVGSGGVMLPNHAPLMVAERFKVLEGLLSGADRPRHRPGAGHRPAHLAGAAPPAGDARRRRLPRPLPGAARLGGQAVSPRAIRSARSGSCPRTCRCRRSGCWGRATTAPSSPGGRGWASPSRIISPAWMPSVAMGATASISGRRVSSPRPHAILTVAVVCAETTAEAERLAASADYGHVRRARGEFGPLVSPEEALAYAWTPEEEVLRRANRRRLFVGDPSQVRERLTAMAQSLGADEIMVMSAIFDPVARIALVRAHGHGIRAATAGLSAEGNPGQDLPSPTRSSLAPFLQPEALKWELLRHRSSRTLRLSVTRPRQWPRSRSRSRQASCPCQPQSGRVGRARRKLRRADPSNH